MRSGCKHTDMKRKSGITNRFDLPGAVQTGWHEEEGGKWRRREGCDLGCFYSLLSRQLASFLPAALSFGLSRYSWRSGIERSTTIERETDKQADKCTWRLKSPKQLRPTNLLTVQFFTITLTLASQFLPRLFLSPLFIALKATEDNSRPEKSLKRPLMPNKSNWILSYHFPFQTIQKRTFIPVKLSSIYLYLAAILPPLFICYWSRNANE